MRLDQRGEKLSVHHNVFWSSKRGLNIEGWGDLNVYNNTSVLNQQPDMMTRNVTPNRGTKSLLVSNDTSFPPIDDWNVINNLTTELVDRVGPSEDTPFTASRQNGTLHPERASARKGVIQITDRGRIQGNLTGFDLDIFKSGELDSLDLLPESPDFANGARSTRQLESESVTSRGTYRGAYDLRDKGWRVGSDWMPYGLEVAQNMAEAEAFAQKYKSTAIVPRIDPLGLKVGLLSHRTTPDASTRDTQ